MKLSNKEVLIVVAYLFIFLVTSVLEAMDRHQVAKRREKKEQWSMERHQEKKERHQEEKEQLQMEKERHQLEMKLHQMRMEKLRQQSKPKKK